MAPPLFTQFNVPASNSHCYLCSLIPTFPLIRAIPFTPEVDSSSQRFFINLMKSRHSPNIVVSHFLGMRFAITVCKGAGSSTHF